MRIPALLAAAAVLVLEAPAAFALESSPIKPPKNVPLLSNGTNAALGVVCLGLKWLFTAAIVFSIVLALLAALDYMRGATDPAKVKSASNRLIFAAVGVAVAILARTLPVLVGTLIGVDSTTTNTSSLCPAS